MKKSYLWLAIGFILSVGALVTFLINMRFSIQFTGGVEMTIAGIADDVELTQDLSAVLIEEFPGVNIGIDQSPSTQTTSVLMDIDIDDDKQVTLLSETITQTLLSEGYISSQEDILSLSLNGPSVSEYMKGTALYAILVGLAFMVIYILISFKEIRHSISPVLLAFVVFVTMLFDMLIPAGAYGLMMMINPVIQIDMIFVIAMLTTMGYSINDTIIIMDRVRENIMLNNKGLSSGNMLYGQIFEKSIRQTLRRSLGTSGSTLVVIIALYIFGNGVIENFAFTMGIGILAGTYSSILIATPLLYILQGKFKKEYKKIGNTK